MNQLKPTANAIQELTTKVWQAARERALQTPTLPKIHQPRFRMRLIQIAYEDAAYMSTLHIAGQSISRSSCKEVGISDSRRLRARGLLKLANLLHHGDSALNTTEMRTIQVQLKHAYEVAITDPDRYFAHVPVYDKRQPDYHKRRGKTSR